MGQRSIFLIHVAFGILLGTLLSQAQTCDDIRTVDFRNATVHSANFDDNELKGLFNTARDGFNFQFKDGVANEYTTPHPTKDEPLEARAKIFADSVVNIPSGPAVRFVQIRWEHLQGTGSYSVLLGLTCSKGAVTPVFQFSSDGADFTVGPGDQIVIKQWIWTQKDAHCCPSQQRTIYYGWDVDHKKFQRLRVDGPNPIPEQH